MKTKYIIYIFSLILLFANTHVSAQKLTNREKLDLLAEDFRLQTQHNTNEALQEANAKGWETENLYGLNMHGGPMYHSPRNNVAAVNTGTLITRSIYSVDGAGLRIGIWDGIPLITHQDFQSRVTIQDGSSPGSTSAHGTHVAGTLVGDPPSSAGSTSRGMAPEALLDAYSSGNDLAEMAGAGAASINEVLNNQKLLVSNHSYGAEGGWQRPAGSSIWNWTGGSANFVGGGSDPAFGIYTPYARNIDNLALAAEYYLIVWAAGNENSHNPGAGSQVRNGTSGPSVTYNTTIHPLGDGTYAAGYDNIYDPSSKNILLVGAVTNGGVISGFSSRGPVIDGRIKPDICGIGVNLTSAINASNTSYGPNSGTSMASPQVAGSLLLLQNLYNDKYKVGSESLFMRAATLKALAINSANDAGNANPDYQYGFGILNTIKAANIVNDDAKLDNTGEALIIEDVIETENDIFKIDFDIESSADLRVTLVYHEVGADTLVNDLDLKVRQLSSGAVIHPWRLDPANPANLATRGDNDVDNVKHMNQGNLAVGTYRAEVSVEGSLYLDDPVPFSLIISGIKQGCKQTVQHKLVDLPTGTYTAKNLIRSEAKLVTAGREITYQTNGRVELRPGFHAKAQTSTGAGYFKTTAGTCN